MKQVESVERGRSTRVRSGHTEGLFRVLEIELGAGEANMARDQYDSATITYRSRSALFRIDFAG